MGRTNPAARKRNADNKELRAGYTSWCKDHSSHAATTATAEAKFPSHVCKGKGNSSKARKYAPGKAYKPTKE